MRVPFVLAIVCVCAAPSHVSAQSAGSSLRFGHTALEANQQQSLKVVARDLSGSALAGAAVTASVRYGKVPRTYRLHRTDSSGDTYLAFRVPAHPGTSIATVGVTISNGYLEQALSGSFHILGFSTPAAGPALRVATRLLPSVVVAPEPAYIVVTAETSSGRLAPHTNVWAAVLFAEGPVHLFARADSAGLATLRVPTTNVQVTERVRVKIAAQWGRNRGAFTSTLMVEASVATPVPTAAAIPAPTDSPTPTSLPTPT
ncbi:MAG: hypothetical protein DLM70_14210, partial [Chloroflexi bacterium]